MAKIDRIIPTFALMRLVLSILLLFSLNAFAQHKCGTTERTNLAAIDRPEYAQGLSEMQELAKRYEAGLESVSNRDAKPVVIPVVVHVIYELEEENISMDQIHSQIAVLNRDFNWRQDDKYKIPEVWRDLGTDSGFEFRLAEVDPDGNFTNGVTRTKTEVEEIGGGDFYYKSNQGGHDPWLQSQYVNIWVCNMSGTVLGYTFLPSTSIEPNDGIVIDFRAFGTMGTASIPYLEGRTLVHEMGHYFGLRHLWGNEEGACTNTDYMNDTPYQREPNFHCSDFPHKSCVFEDDGDMFMNFMDYADDTCALLFTKDQIGFMQLVLRTSKVTLIHSNAVTRVDEAFSSPTFKLFPNPSSGSFDIMGTMPSKSQSYLITDIQGRRMSEGKLSSHTTSIDLHHLSAGVYVFNSGGVVQRIVIKPSNE